MELATMAHFYSPDTGLWITNVPLWWKDTDRWLALTGAGRVECQAEPQAPTPLLMGALEEGQQRRVALRLGVGSGEAVPQPRCPRTHYPRPMTPQTLPPAGCEDSGTVIYKSLSPDVVHHARTSHAPVLSPEV